MRLSKLHVSDFKRFTDLNIDDLSNDAKLILLSGPNGTGKSSLFDALKAWHWYNGSQHNAYDASYHDKIQEGGTQLLPWTSRIQATFDIDIAELNSEERKKIIYIRSAHRNEAEFAVNGLSNMPSPLDTPRVQRTIDNDISVSHNYQRLLMNTFTAVYDTGADDNTTRAELREGLIGTVKQSLQAVFPDLVLTGLSSSPLSSGTFVFTKGNSRNFPYKNLSAGEKSAFDLILDMVLSGQFYDNTIWCLDEPETHLNTRVQSKLLDQLLYLLPSNCQLILASHSLGFMRRAWELAQDDPSKVQFLDFQDVDFDNRVEMKPTPASRKFWDRALDMALGDLAALVAPEQIVLCEGRPVSSTGRSSNSEFDAKCFRKIFAAEFPNTDFISMGNSDDVRNDKLELGRKIQTISSGTKVIRVTDRDLLNGEEIAELETAGVKVLTKRNIESYLLDDEILQKFADAQGHSSYGALVIKEKSQLIANSIGRGNDSDDLKSIAGELYTFIRRQFSLSGSGSSWHAFAVESLAELISADTACYQDLKSSIF